MPKRWRVRAWAESATIRLCCRGFVGKGETARGLWERALAPMGLTLATQVVRHAAGHGSVPGFPQDERFATKAPMIRRTVALTEERQPMITSLVLTVIGPDRPGIVSQLAARAQGLGANWAGSRMATLAGQFAGMVHLEVPTENADALASALQELQSPDLRVVIARSGGPPAPAGHRLVKIELVGHDRQGIVRDLSAIFAQRNVSIEELHTEVASAAMSGEHLFKVKALLRVPDAIQNDDLRRGLEALANEMMVDISL